MTVTVAELIERLQKEPPDREVRMTYEGCDGSPRDGAIWYSEHDRVLYLDAEEAHEIWFAERCAARKAEPQ